MQPGRFNVSVEMRPYQRLNVRCCTDLKDETPTRFFTSVTTNTNTPPPPTPPAPPPPAQTPQPQTTSGDGK